jgi:hypothetical protein
MDSSRADRDLWTTEQSMNIQFVGCDDEASTDQRLR